MKKKTLTLFLSLSLAVSALSGCDSAAANSGNSNRVEEPGAETRKETKKGNTEEEKTVSETETVYLKTKEISYDADGAISGSAEWEYDACGNLIKNFEYNADVLYAVLIHMNMMKREIKLTKPFIIFLTVMRSGIPIPMNMLRTVT